VPILRDGTGPLGDCLVRQLVQEERGQDGHEGGGDDEQDEGRTTDAEVGHEVQRAADVGDRKCDSHHRHADSDLRGLDTAESQGIVLSGHDAPVGGHVTKKLRCL
jgi:hypothetical protein